MHTRLRRAIWTLLPAALLLVAATAAQACPGCKEALAANDPNHQNIVRGYFWSILFMMGMPYLTLCSFGGYMYLLVRRSRAAQQASDEAQAATDELVDVVEQLDEPKV